MNKEINLKIREDVTLALQQTPINEIEPIGGRGRRRDRRKKERNLLKTKNKK